MNTHAQKACIKTIAELNGKTCVIDLGILCVRVIYIGLKEHD